MKRKEVVIDTRLVWLITNVLHPSFSWNISEGVVLLVFREKSSSMMTRESFHGRRTPGFILWTLSRQHQGKLAIITIFLSLPFLRFPSSPLPPHTPLFNPWTSISHPLNCDPFLSYYFSPLKPREKIVLDISMTIDQERQLWVWKEGGLQRQEGSKMPFKTHQQLEQIERGKWYCCVVNEATIQYTISLPSRPSYRPREVLLLKELFTEWTLYFKQFALLHWKGSESIIISSQVRLEDRGQSFSSLF